jgi:ferredoxin
MAFVPTRRIRILVQGGVFALWVALILATHHPMDSALLKILPASLFLRIDPLVLTAVTGGIRIGVTLLMLGFVTLGISMLLGRVFCGWICPLGTIFDFYGWFIRRMRIRFFGPSPSWFRLKYYVLIAILVFAVFGVVSPLMGLDPIVLLTRTIAAFVNPIWRARSDLSFHAGGSLGFRGSFIDVATLILFITIMASTTKVSRIWCRTTCPLGAYLAVTSRHSVLRRQTEGCIHCNICSAHCPTGAIDFQNAEIYNESECIKCFACSQECPVDANFFTLKNPLPAMTKTYAPVSLERRQVLVTGAMVVAAAPVLQLSTGSPNSTKTLIRPPMSREEHDFLSSCIRCGECMKACPTGILKPAGIFDHGIRALWTPVMIPTEGPCLEGCNACSQACPTDAILKYPIEEKYAYKAGTAVFNSSLCISVTENKFCSECVRVCPTNAIEITKGWEPEKIPGQANVAGASEMPAPAGQTPTRPIHVMFDQCVGCGACENACNQIVFGEPAMVTTSFGRAMPTKLKKS